MKNRELFLEKINIDKTLSIQIDPDNQDYLIIYENGVKREHFSLRKRIFTLFKDIQTFTKAPKAIYDQKNNCYIYGNKIYIKDDVYMVVSDEHEELVLKFFHTKDKEEDKLLYLTKMNYMTQKLFHRMLIPHKVIKNPKYSIINPIDFKDLMEILGMIKI